MNFDSYKRMYYKRYSMCGKLGYRYSVEDGMLFDGLCMMWKCRYCRSILRYRYFMDILRFVYAMDLDKHFIITVPGKEYRDEHMWFESFDFMAKKWDVFRKRIDYYYPGFVYIVFPRSQKSGYCHYHIICNKGVSWYYLDKVRKELGLGFVSIQRNRSVADYLALDYWKDYEWIIPEGKRHFSSSRCIKLCDYESKPMVHYDYSMNLDGVKKDLVDRFGIVFNDDDYYIRKIMDHLKRGIVDIV